MKTASGKIMKVFGLSLLMMASGTLFAEEKEDDRFPSGCRDTGYQFELKTVQLLPHTTASRQSMYFLYNSLPEKVTLFQMRDGESSRSMFLNHVISPRQWAVLSTSEKKVKYICTVPEKNSRYGKIIDCKESLKVCEFTNVKYGLNNRGNYWLVNSNTKNGALREVVRYGIIPAI